MLLSGFALDLTISKLDEVDAADQTFHHMNDYAIFTNLNSLTPGIFQ